jgi:hypothetical protein
MTSNPSFAQLVTQVLMMADRPLTIAEIKAWVEMVRPVDTRKLQATIRNAINSIPLAARYFYRHVRNEGTVSSLSCSGLKGRAR